ncbi:ADP-heptose--lipooligosaccharide heptosyltransferase II [hydrothermal vent metagenome]|uniref:ADP-heptose--lipooligosaccharide heptosyltransferase II n=1 Tax=hydrothermal vent metagenome TaxID=652676 RepID=A0A3B1D608_9ZZZZ
MKKILIIRNDKLGDFMLAYPSFALLKENMPDTILAALVPAYTQEMAEACPWIDQVLIDPTPESKWHSGFSLAKIFQDEQFDAVITLYSRARVGLAAVLASIPYRLAPASKFAQVFYNHRLTQRRSRSEKPEHEYNQDLVRHFLKQQNIPILKNPKPPFLRFSDQETEEKKRHFCHQNKIDPNHLLIFMHPGSGGSANNLSLAQYAKLAKNLESKQGHNIVLTAGPGELKAAKSLSTLLNQTPHLIFESKKGLRHFAQHIQFADLFISGSTGPLHIAGALDTPTAAFYPQRRSATALRWQTLNSPRNRLSFSPTTIDQREESLNINVDEAARLISEKFLLK